MISLDKQVQIYSVDTSHFYNKKEMKIHKQLNKLYKFRNNVKKLKESKKENIDKQKLDEYYRRCNSLIKIRKEKLCKLLLKQNNIRSLDSELVTKRNIISIFESTLSRTLKMRTNCISEELIVVRVYFFEVLRNIINDGFMYKGEKYIYYSSSAGQIRTKKAVFIRESTYHKHANALMCGLSVAKINELGGVNTNKYMAYLALSNSATDLFSNFDINKTIVVEDLETTIEEVVDFIDEKTYKITRGSMNVPIVQTDGAGMMLPRVSKKNFMFRAPWVKGLLVSYPFDKFVSKYGSRKIKDIYGKEWDIIDDNIEIIFTKSQFKMWKYYSSWQDYKDNFIRYGCEAGICNMEDDEFSNAKLNYQMLQTLDLTNEELLVLSASTINDIKKIGNDKETMLRVLGVTESNPSKNYYQKALSFYPELLADTYSREILKDVKKSLVKNARAGKLNINGKYTFVIPDMFAFCEYLFLGDKNPKGLLNKGEVSCKLYSDGAELDCLRSPHLYREHAIRTNAIDTEKKKWFTTDGIYISVHDMISKILMLDVDGDKLLVCADTTLVEAAKRNMEDIVPLFYNMAVAGKGIISNEALYSGLVAAYTGGNIGIISNNITKVWNSNNTNLDVIKWLCAENNFTIDYAKTLYKPQRPKEINKIIMNYTKSKVPNFFIYAKNKDKKNVEKINNSVVNRLESVIPNPKLQFNATNLGKFNYKLLMNNSGIQLDQEIIKKYTELDLHKRFMSIIPVDGDFTGDNIHQYHDIRRQILEVNNDINFIVDVLVLYLYNHKKSNHKTTLWSCFGDVIIENLERNIDRKLDDGYMQCKGCGKRIEITGKNQKLCVICWKIKEKERQKLKWHKNKYKYRNSATAF